MQAELQEQHGASALPPPFDSRTDFLRTDSPKTLILLNAAMALGYFYVLACRFSVGNPVLFGLLLAGEVFHLWLILTFLYTVWDTSAPPAKKRHARQQPVDVFITVAGEPVDLVEETINAAKKMEYPDFGVHLLNDGYVAGKQNWRDIESLAQRLGVHCITRTVSGGAKAGNINNALKMTHRPLVAIFDADHAPHPDFLRKTADYFAERRVAFVQTPQYYKNYGVNYLTKASWEQQELFFGPICRGKNRLNAATMCGTNMVIRREALASVGGMCTESIAEDFVTGLFMHARGWRSVYVPEVLAEGLATEDLSSYSKQQFRWARGAFDVIFRYNPLFMQGLTWAQRVQYLASASFFLAGAVVLLDMALPLVFLYTGLVPIEVSGMLLASVFLPYLFLTLYVIQRASHFTFSFPSLGFSMGAFSIHLEALAAAALRRKSTFVVTQKRRQSGNFLPLVGWHLLYIALALAGIPLALMRGGFTASFVNNLAWIITNVVILSPFIRAALPSRAPLAQKGPAPKPLQAPQRTYGVVQSD